MTPIGQGELEDPRRLKTAGPKRRVAMEQIRALDLAWEAKHSKPDLSMFRREILPQIQGVPINRLAGAPGLSKAACSLIRAGKVVPHPRHWEPLREFQ